MQSLHISIYTTKGLSHYKNERTTGRERQSERERVIEKESNTEGVILSDGL